MAVEWNERGTEARVLRLFGLKGWALKQLSLGRDEGHETTGTRERHNGADRAASRSSVRGLAVTISGREAAVVRRRGRSWMPLPLVSHLSGQLLLIATRYLSVFLLDHVFISILLICHPPLFLNRHPQPSRHSIHNKSIKHN